MDEGLRAADAPAATADAGPRVVIVGAGFAGLEVAKALGRAGVATTVVDRQNHHLFQPLLYQVATAALSAPEIAYPIRAILRPYRSVQVLLGTVLAVDHAARTVTLAHGGSLRYDYLVLAAGAVTGYFGHDSWAEVAPGLKTVEDARAIRARILLAFERAERSDDPDERARLTTVAVIGGGPTGVEMSGSIAELARYTLARDFRRIAPENARILLIEAGPRLLGAFDESLGAYARARIERLGVTVLTGRTVDDVREEAVTVAGERIPVGLTVWAAGVRAAPIAEALGLATDRAGRIPVAATLEVPGRPGVFALGDIAACPDRDGKPLPGLAQVAKQQGVHLGRALAAYLRDGTPLPPFTYRSRGDTAIIGRHSAVYQTERLRLRGWPAWMLWAIVHVYLLVGFQNRLLVSTQWLWRYLTYERGARLITSDAVGPGSLRAPQHGSDTLSAD